MLSFALGRGSRRRWAVVVAAALSARCGSGASSVEMGGTRDAAAPSARADTVGPAPLRRLTREQYDNAIHALLGLARDPAITFTADEGDAGFDANARDAVTSLQLDEYRHAATDLASRAVAQGLGTVAPCAAGADEVRCGQAFVAGFGKRAFRRPLAPAELDRYQRLFGAERTARGYASAVALVIRAMLQSPSFLYRVELGRGGAAASDGTVPLGPYEVASRLSFFLWNGIPDAALLARADADQLRTAGDILAVARQMIHDPQARQAVASFARQWMDVQGLSTISRNDPAFTGELRSAMADELVDFTDAVVRQGDGRLATLLTASFTFIHGASFALYGLAQPADPTRTVRVEIPASQTRAGISTLPAVMATHAHPDQTSPVHRGFLVRSQLLCTTPPPPPATVNNTPPQVDPNVSSRRRFEQHRADPACNACHALMDPLGVVFEMFDPIGRHRTMDGKQPVDSTGQLTGTAGNDGAVSDPVELARRLVASPEVRDCVARQWFRYLSGRAETPDDAPAIAAAVAALQGSQGNLLEMLIAYTGTRSFRTWRSPQ